MLTVFITVDSVGDESASDVTTSAETATNTITLRSSLERANYLAGNLTIDFAITGSGPFTIQPGSALPTLNADGITIDGLSQSGILLDGTYAGSAASGIVIAASQGTIQGLTIQNFAGAGIKINGEGSEPDVLVLDRPVSVVEETSASLVEINGEAPTTGDETRNSAHGNTVANNVIKDNGLAGVLVWHASVNTITGNTITGNTITGNTITGNQGAGVEIVGSGDAAIVNHIVIAGESITIGGETITVTNSANRNAILGNTIDGNAGDGVRIDGASDNRLGAEAAGNTITNNAGNGIQVTGIVHQIIQDGVDVTDGRQPAGPWGPEQLQAGGEGGVIGLAAQFAGVLGLGSLFSPSTATFTLSVEDIEVVSTGAIPAYNRIQGNFIGTNADADSGLGNEVNGILVGRSARLTVIGSESFAVPPETSTMPAAGNVIAGNGASGIQIEGDPLNPTAIDEPENSFGSHWATQDTFPTTEQEAFDNNFANNIPTFELIPTIIAGNSIGVDPDAQEALGNGADGVLLSHARAFVINNTIAANSGDGLEILGAPQFALYVPADGAGQFGLPRLDVNSLVQGNRIGVGWDGAQLVDSHGVTLGNAGAGVLVTTGAQFNIIGALVAGLEDEISPQDARDLAEGQANVLANNAGWGVHVEGLGVFHTSGPSQGMYTDPFLFPVGLAHPYGTIGMVIAANNVGVDATGVGAAGNGAGGILVDNAAAYTLIGAPFLPLEMQFYGNVISSNGLFDEDGDPIESDRPGVKISDPGTMVTVLGGNFIGLAHDRQTGAGDNPLGNAGPGVWITNMATTVNVGGDGTYAASGSRNYIAANFGPGVFVENSYDLMLVDIDPGATQGNPRQGVDLKDHVFSELGKYFTNEIDNCWIGLGVEIGFDQDGAPNSWTAKALDPLEAPLGNQGDGVWIKDASYTILGGFHPAWTTNTIAGNLGAGVRITGAPGHNKAWLNYLIQNNIGADPSGTGGGAAFANAGDGVLIEGTATYNLIQGAGFSELKFFGQIDFAVDQHITTPAAALAAKNSFDEDDNGNIIGNNAGNGIRIDGASNNIIGGGNYIGTDWSGQIELRRPATAPRKPSGNYIGTDWSGQIELPNAANGILITGGAQGNLVVPWARIDLVEPYDPEDPSTSPYLESNWTYTAMASIIANNTGAGVKIEGVGTSENLVSGSLALSNPFFPDIELTTPNRIIGNAGGGVVLIDAADHNTIGGTAEDAGNVIADNTGHGVTIAGKAIGITAAGANGGLLELTVSTTAGLYATQLLGLTFVFLVDAQTEEAEMVETATIVSVNAANSTIRTNVSLGGRTPQLGTGAQVIYNIPEYNQVLRNWIGADEADAPRPNSGDGVLINASSNNTVAGNTIAHNGGNGVRIMNGAAENVVGGAASNRITANAQYGVVVEIAAKNNTIGGTEEGSGNVITDNGPAQGTSGGGILIARSKSNKVLSNAITGNHGDGIQITDGAEGNQIGVDMELVDGAEGAVNSPSYTNIIEGNSRHGIWLNGAGGGDAKVAHNYISGNIIQSDDDAAINITDGAEGNVIGAGGSGFVAPSEYNAITVYGNLIAYGENGVGVHIDEDSKQNAIIGNSFIGDLDDAVAIDHVANFHMPQITNLAVTGTSGDYSVALTYDLPSGSNNSLVRLDFYLLNPTSTSQNVQDSVIEIGFVEGYHVNDGPVSASFEDIELDSLAGWYLVVAATYGLESDGEGGYTFTGDVTTSPLWISAELDSLLPP